MQHSMATHRALLRREPPLNFTHAFLSCTAACDTTEGRLATAEMHQYEDCKVLGRVSKVCRTAKCLRMTCWFPWQVSEGEDE